MGNRLTGPEWAYMVGAVWAVLEHNRGGLVPWQVEQQMTDDGQPSDEILVRCELGNFRVLVVPVDG